MKTITVKCPQCRETIEIDVQAGTVVRHHAEVKAKPGSDFLGERLRGLEEEKARREARVAEEREREKGKRGEFDQLFRKVREEGGKKG